MEAGGAGDGPEAEGAVERGREDAAAAVED